MLIIGGTTASGKSDLAVRLAKKLNGEIISADSMQIYRRMNIGTAKITIDEMNGIRHHLIDVVDPTEEFSVAEFSEMARNIIADIEQRGKYPIVVGGTGLYIDSLLYKHSFGNALKDDALRERLRSELTELGNEAFHQKLREIDPKAADVIHPNNAKRMIRAMEIMLVGGRSVTEKDEKAHEMADNIKFIVKTGNRETLYERINRRVDLMFDAGLEKEVRTLVEEGVSFECQSMQAIGYKEFKPYFEGKLDKIALIELIKKNTRNYAKRQQTWFRRYENCISIDAENDETIIKMLYGDKNE